MQQDHLIMKYLKTFESFDPESIKDQSIINESSMQRMCGSDEQYKLIQRLQKELEYRNLGIKHVYSTGKTPPITIVLDIFQDTGSEVIVVDAQQVKGQYIPAHIELPSWLQSKWYEKYPQDHPGDGVEMKFRKKRWEIHEIWEFVDKLIQLFS